MKIAKRNQKEQNIINAAEKIFGALGFRNAKMDDIAKEAGITKVTLYSYFQSKENLYMAITFRAFKLLTDIYYEAIDRHKSETGLESCMAISRGFIGFCEQNLLYAECLLEYLSLLSTTGFGLDTEKMTNAMTESHFFKKCLDIQALPAQLTTKEITRGQQDGSIKNPQPSIVLHLHGWMLITGYARVVSFSENGIIPLYEVPLTEMRGHILHSVRQILQDPN